MPENSIDPLQNESDSPTFEPQIPPLEPVDVLGLLLLPYPFTPKGRGLFPDRGPETDEDYVRAYREGLRQMLPTIAPDLLELGLIRSESVSEIAREELVDMFLRWWRDDLPQAVRPLYATTPRMRAVAQHIDRFRRDGVLPGIKPGNHLAALRRYAKKLGREKELRDALPDQMATETDEVISGIWMADDPRAVRLEWDSDGFCTMVPNIPCVFDALVRGNRSVHRKSQDIPFSEIDQAIAPDAVGSDESPEALAGKTETVQKILGFCQTRGAEFLAAYEHLTGIGTIRVLAEKHGVSVAAIQRAEAEIRRQFDR